MGLFGLAGVASTCRAGRAVGRRRRPDRQPARRAGRTVRGDSSSCALAGRRVGAAPTAPTRHPGRRHPPTLRLRQVADRLPAARRRDHRPEAPPRPAPATSGASATGAAAPRFQAIYARASDHSDQYGTIVPCIRKWAAEADAVFMASAAPSGAHPPHPVGARRRLPADRRPRGALTQRRRRSATTIAELTALGYNDPSRKYVVWMDANEMCGDLLLLRRRPARRRELQQRQPLVATGRPWSRIDNGCWGLGSDGESIEAHEMMHALGSVMPTSPHATHPRPLHRRRRPHVLQGRPDHQGQRRLRPPARKPSSTAARTTTSMLRRHPPATSPATGTRPAAPSCPRPTATIRSASSAGRSPKGDPFTAKPLAFTVSLAVPQNNPASVRWSTVDGTAVAGSDYEPASGTLIFAPGRWPRRSPST